MSTVLDSIQRIQRVARSAAKTNGNLNSLHGIDSGFANLSDPKMLARFREVNVPKACLRGLLDELDLATLRHIEVLMYAGRDGDPVAALKHHLPSVHPRKEDVVRSIEKKWMSLDVYLTKGMERAAAEGIDVDGF